MYYLPETLVIEVGETVEWYNANGFHDVVITQGPEMFSLPAVTGPAVIGSITFNLPGTYEYICSVYGHADMGMVGTIIVNESLKVNPKNIPVNFKLEKIFPNPFNPKTNINYSLNRKTKIKINIYNNNGEKIVTLKDGVENIGSHSISWHAMDYPSGLYFLKIDGEDFRETHKLMLIK
tara:strand:- start:777 stop:1310 length:534 start_codon:yes stop_codon:yes gene_type:complete